MRLMCYRFWNVVLAALGFGVWAVSALANDDANRKPIYEEEETKDQPDAAPTVTPVTPPTGEFFQYGDRDADDVKAGGHPLAAKAEFALGLLTTVGTPTAFNRVKFHSPSASASGPTDRLWDNDGLVHSSQLGIFVRYSYPVAAHMWLDGDLFFRQIAYLQDDENYVPASTGSYVSTSQRASGLGVSTAIRRTFAVYPWLLINPGVGFDLERTSVNYQAHINDGAAAQQNLATLTSIMYTAALKAKLQIALRADALDIFADLSYGVPMKLQETTSSNVDMASPSHVTYGAGVSNNIKSMINHRVESAVSEIVLGASYHV